MQSNSSQLSYDDTPYPNYVFADTHPSRIAAIGKLFNKASPDSRNARVLEIGCAGGLNILTHALSLPLARFVAVDSSSPHIAQAQQLKALSGITNVEFFCKTAESLDDSFGQFDFIICHGLYSWVPKPIQHELLRVCHQRLSPQGIAFISYNTLPGWHLQQVIRDALLFRTREIKDPSERIAKAKEFLRFSQPLFPKHLAPALSPTIEHLLEVEEAYLLHDHLGTHNYPLYFEDFVEACALYNLEYLAEIEVGSMIPKEFSESAQRQITELAHGSLRSMEQYLDFLKLRQFRKSLICHATCSLNRNIDHLSLLPMFVRAKKSVRTKNYESSGRLVGSSLEALEACFPRWVAVSDLVSLLKLPAAKVSAELLDALMHENLELRDAPCPLSTTEVSVENLSNLAKAIIPCGSIVPNLASDAVALSTGLHTALKQNNQLTKENIAELQRLGLLSFGDTEP